MKRRDGSVADRITDARKIIGLRNSLIHGYAVINPQITWEIIAVNVPALRRELDGLLGN